MAHQARAYPGLPGWMEVLLELSVLPKNRMQCPRQGLESGLLDPETSALLYHEATMNPYLPIINQKGLESFHGGHE